MKLIVLFFISCVFGCATAERQIKPVLCGSDLYRAKCTSCHRLYPSNNYTYDELKLYIEQFGEGLDRKEQDLLLEYFNQENLQESGCQ